MEPPCDQCGFAGPCELHEYPASQPQLPGGLGQVEKPLTRAALVAALGKVVNQGGIINRKNPVYCLGLLADELAKGCE